MKIKKIIVVAAILAVASIGLLASCRIKTGQIYIYQNNCNFQVEKWQSQPPPYVEIMTVLQITNGYTICHVVGVRSDGQQWDRVQEVSFEHLHTSSKAR